jgi:SAM-dependent methyltransferase
MTTLAGRIEDLTRAYVPAMAVFAAVDLGLFDALAEPTTIAALAVRLAATEDGVARLCRALAALGLVELAGTQVAAVPEARTLLARSGAASLADVVHHHHRQLLPPLLHLADAVRTGRPQHAAWPFAITPVAGAPYDELARHPSEVAAMVAAMDHDSATVGTAIAGMIDLRDARLLADVGCGGGAVARELLRALPGLRVASFDRGAACEVARARSQAAGLAERHTVADRDARDGIPITGADAVLLSAILADFPAGERLEILRQARAALRPGGRVLISETLLDRDRRGPPKAALLSLLTLAVTTGDQLSGDQLHAELAEAGFIDTTTHPGTPRDLVVAVRPSEDRTTA